jgi:hypothetical protein
LRVALIFLLTTLLLNACATRPVSTLTMVDPPGVSLRYPGTGQVKTVSSAWVKGAPQTVSVHPGLRIIGYCCPEYVCLDDRPEIVHYFKSGTHYEMTCRSGAPVFRAIGKAKQPGNSGGE